MVLFCDPPLPNPGALLPAEKDTPRGGLRAPDVRLPRSRACRAGAFGSTRRCEGRRVSTQGGSLGIEKSEATLHVPGLRVPVQPEQVSIAIDGAIKVPALEKGAIDSVEGLILLLERQGSMIDEEVLESPDA